MKQYLPFRFQQFEVQQQKSAMKVGTDGVLLGAWCLPPENGNVLDIGSGTGLISLMLAQRFPSLQITGIDIDPGAIEESEINFKNSPWNERLQVIGCSLQDFPSQKFDFIVSNPPFFPKEKNFSATGASRQSARMDGDLNFEELFFHCDRLLTPNGKVALIIPYSEWEECRKIGEKNLLFPEMLTWVKGNKEAPIKRVLAQFSREKKEVKSSELIIENARHQYSEAYSKLTEGFYL